MKYFLALLYTLTCVCVWTMAYPAEDTKPSAARQQRDAHDHDHHDVVDFGAHTGEHGSFGWYADFPVHSHDD